MESIDSAKKAMVHVVYGSVWPNLYVHIVYIFEKSDAWEY